MSGRDARPAPAVDDAAVVVARDGQMAWLLSSVPRARYATGQQEWCSGCADAGVRRLGVSRDGAGSDPLCLSCWTRRQHRAASRPLTPEESGWLVELAEQLACEVCRLGAVPAAVELPPAAVQARRRRRRRDRRERHERPRSVAAERRRQAGCWRCGDAEWVASVRAVHVADQEELAAADADRCGRLQLEHQRALQEVARAERRLRHLQVWQGRVADVVEAMPKLTKTGPRGRLELRAAPGGRARPVWLVADFLARAAVDRSARGLSNRGRPPQHALVVAVMAINANSRAGHRSMAGLDWTALFAGLATKTVTTAWAYSVQVGSTTCLEVGGACTLEEREATGRRRRRSVYDFAHLHTSPVDAAPFLGAATAVVARLLQRAGLLVDEQQALLARACQAAARAEAAVLDAEADVAERTAEDLQLQASVDEVWAGDARTATAAAVQLRVRAGQALAPPPRDRRSAMVAGRARRAAAAGVATAFDLVERMANFYDPPRRGQGETSPSGYHGFTRISGRSTSPLACPRRPTGRSEEQLGASRSPTREMTRPTTPNRPRMPYRAPASPQYRRRASACPGWAKTLAEGLLGPFAFLRTYVDAAGDVAHRGALAAARERGLRLHQVAVTLGAQLGPDWTVDDVVALVERYAGVHSVIGAGDAHSPLAYLRAVVRRALTNPTAVVPWPSPTREAFERDVDQARRDVDQARRDVDQARRDADEAQRAARDEQWQAHATAAAAERAGAGDARSAALDQARRATVRAAEARQARADRLAAVETRAAASASTANDQGRPTELDATHADPDAASAMAWPETAVPGGGLPPSWRPGNDRDHRSPTHHP